MREQSSSTGTLHNDGPHRQRASNNRRAEQVRTLGQSQAQDSPAMAAHMFPSNPAFQPSQMTQPTGNVNLDAFSLPNTALHSAPLFEPNNLVSSHLAGAGTFLGIAQQTSDNPIPNDEIMHLFNGEDMNYWLGGNHEFNGIS